MNNERHENNQYTALDYSNSTDLLFAKDTFFHIYTPHYINVYCAATIAANEVAESEKSA
ncbi:MAG: hypothetical protein ACJA2S_005412 [Cyclobacteriaceae bacterium]|jgi:hypothetical protein